MKSPVSMDICPQGGWRVRFSQTGHEVVADHRSVFKMECRKHMEANDIPVTGGWFERLLSEMCDQHPEFGCLDDSAPQVRRLASEDVWRFLSTLWNAMESGAKQVSPEEQERRLNICAVCPKRGVIQCSFGCGKLAEVLTRLAIGSPAKIRQDMHKQNCLACGCEISSMTSFPLEVLQAVDDKLGTVEPYDGKCWKLEPIPQS